MKRVVVFGTGEYYQKKKHAIQDQIIGFLDNYKTGMFEGVRIYTVNDIQRLCYDVVYVMAGENVFADMVYQLMSAGVSPEAIVIGQNMLPRVGRENLYLDENRTIIIGRDGLLCYRTGNISISFANYDELCGIQDIFGERTYDFSGDGGSYIVVDIGMNIGAASLYFAMRDDVEKVYAFEPFPDTYRRAVKNIARNEKYKLKIIPQNAGLGSKSSMEEMQYNSSMTCGMTTQKELFNITVDQYKSWGFYHEKDETTASIELLDAGDVLERIFSENQGKKFILKMDCEGSEYEIFERLDEKGFIGKFSVIMMEWHYLGRERIEAYLKKEKFHFFSFQKNGSMGVIYAVRRGDE